MIQVKTKQMSGAAETVRIENDTMDREFGTMDQSVRLKLQEWQGAGSDCSLEMLRNLQETYRNRRWSEVQNVALFLSGSAAGYEGTEGTVQNNAAMFK